jgi:hypothetical protein
MITGFKPRFVPFVRDGSKQHTLRDIRKGDRQIVVGDRLDLYENVRQKNQTLIGRHLCTRVQVARFYWISGKHVMTIDGVALSRDEADGFAWSDGFRHPRPNEGKDTARIYTTDTVGCFALMIQYWIDEGKELPFEKQLLHWKYADRLPDELPKKRGKRD